MITAIEFIDGLANELHYNRMKKARRSPFHRSRQPKFYSQIRLNFQLHPTEPADYTGSYTTARKEIVDIEISMHQSAGTAIIIATITIASRTIATTEMQTLLLLKLTVSEEQVECLP